MREGDLDLSFFLTAARIRELLSWSPPMGARRLSSSSSKSWLSRAWVPSILNVAILTAGMRLGDVFFPLSLAGDRHVFGVVTLLRDVCVLLTTALN